MKSQLDKEDFQDTSPNKHPGFEDTQPGKIVLIKPERKVSREPMVLPSRSPERTNDNIVERRGSDRLESEHRYNLEIEDRKFRYSIMRIVISCFCIVMIIVISALVYSMIFQHQGMNDSTLKAFLETLTDILKVLKPSNSPG